MNKLRFLCGLLIVTSLPTVSLCANTPIIVNDENDICLEAYLAQLYEIRDRWQEAAQLAYEGNTQEALASLRFEYPSNISLLWKKRFLSALRGLIEKNKASPFNLDFARWCFRMENPHISVQVLNKTIECGEELDSFDRLFLSQALIESRKYNKAVEIMSELLRQDNIKGDMWWIIICENRLNTIESLEDDAEPPIEFYRRIYLDPRLRWYRNRLHPIISVWQSEDANASDLDKVKLLSELFAAADDFKGQKLALSWVVENADDTTNAEDIARAMLELGYLACKEKDYNHARQLWEQVQANYEDTDAAKEATSNIELFLAKEQMQDLLGCGFRLKELKEYEKAIETFKKVIYSDLDEGKLYPKIMSTHPNFRAKAQWEITNCFFEMGDYVSAIQAYRESREKYRFHGWCGTCVALKYTSRNYLHEGVCFEYLGCYDEAVKTYWKAATKFGRFHSDPTALIRIVDLYQKANQIEDLKNWIAVEDERYQARSPNVRYLPGNTVHRVLEIRAMGKNKEWDVLIKILQNSTTDLPYERGYQIAHPDWQFFEAAKALAQYPHETVPLLKRQIVGSRYDKHFYYTLGLCATDEVASILKEKAQHEKKRYQLKAIIYALSLAGEIGNAAIDELAVSASDVLGSLIEQYEKVGLREYKKYIPFPDIPADIKLPASLSTSNVSCETPKNTLPF